MTIWLDMDGTIVDLYGENGWLDDLKKERTKPYRNAKPLVNMKEFTKVVKQKQNSGVQFGIISWTSKNSTQEYHEKVAATKRKWLSTHCPNINWDSIHIVEYGTPKEEFGQRGDVLVDDELRNRQQWKCGEAYGVEDIIGVLTKC